MKIRHGFVSNSSSTAFIVCRNELTRAQEDLLLGCTPALEEGWKIGIVNDHIIGYVDMDNFEIEDVLLVLEIHSARICSYPDFLDYAGLEKLVRLGKVSEFNGLYGVWDPSNNFIAERVPGKKSRKSAKR